MSARNGRLGSACRETGEHMYVNWGAVEQNLNPPVGSGSVPVVWGYH
jgi:hypothetical protein